MRPFAFAEASDTPEALRRLREGERALAGGTNLIDLMKLEVEAPERLAFIGRIGLDGVETDGDGLRIGALVSNADCAADERVRRDWPLLARAILAGASPQLRNKATTGGNLCQRTRCNYFYDRSQRCNKREPGSGCDAMDGVNRMHAVLGTSEQCIATYPGDMAVALYALDATVLIEGPAGGREVPVRKFHRLPGDSPERDNVLEPGDLITAVRLPAPVGGLHVYKKVRDRASYAFALVSVAAAVRVEGRRIAHAGIAFGNLGTIPWHDPAVESALVGETPSVDLFDRAADVLLEKARGHGDNDFKIPLARRTLIAALREATGA